MRREMFILPLTVSRERERRKGVIWKPLFNDFLGRYGNYIALFIDGLLGGMENKENG